MKDCEEKASSFLVKLLNMLRSKENAKTIAWDSNEGGIRILNQQKLEEVLLPKYFRHKKFSSFVRQLNMYDFHKTYLSDNTSIFCHDVFNPRDKESIFKIKRKAPPCNDENAQGGKGNNKGEMTDKNLPNVEEKEQSDKFKRRQSISSSKASFKLLFKNSINSLNQRELSAEQVLQQIIDQIAPLKLSQQSIRQKLSQLRKFPKFRSFLKRSSFIAQIYSKLGVSKKLEDDELSELSIDQELMFDTKKSLTLRSLKMFESGPINLRDTLGMLLN